MGKVAPQAQHWVRSQAVDQVQEPLVTAEGVEVVTEEETVEATPLVYSTSSEAAVKFRRVRTVAEVAVVTTEGGGVASSLAGRHRARRTP